MAKGFDYQKEILINEDELDLEWKRQPELLLKYATAKADAQWEVDQAKEALDLLVAEKDLDIRENSDKKPTESAIKNMVELDEEVQEANQKLIKCKHNFALLTAAVDAFNCRRSALENLVKLHSVGYFAEPIADIEDRGVLENARAKTAREKIKSAMSEKTSMRRKN